MQQGCTSRVCMETLRFGQLSSSCEPVEKEWRSKNKYCIIIKKVQKFTYMGDIYADGKGHM